GSLAPQTTTRRSRARVRFWRSRVALLTLSHEHNCRMPGRRKPNHEVGWCGARQRMSGGLAGVRKLLSVRVLLVDRPRRRDVRVVGGKAPGLYCSGRGGRTTM